MAVQCTKCGEELMGSVNRCWRCGQEFVARRTEGDLPPVRRSPVVDAAIEVFVAEVSVVEASALEANVAAEQASSQRDTNVVRRGSPFGDRGTAILETVKPGAGKPGAGNDGRDEQREREVRYQKRGGAAASATLTVPLAVVSFAAAFLFPIAGGLLSLLGVGFGVWGLSSRRRGLAFVGLLLCCLSLVIATFNGVIDLYVSWYGVAPWESDAMLP
jgi:hypothetical protein